MKRLNWQIVFSVSLIALSVLLYLLHFIIFRDTQRIFIDLLEYIAFVPIQVLMVTIIIDQLLKVREKRSMLKKLNMVIGVFFSEVGINLIKHFGHFDNSFDELRKQLVLKNDWSGKDFLAAHRNIKAFAYRIESKKESLEPLRGFLNNERGFLLGLLENPNLLEHETFTELLWAVTHVAEELVYRDDLKGLPDADYAHLSNDIKRAYTLLIVEWLAYMKHLRSEYPYLYSLAVRTNPFDPEATVKFT